MKYEVIFIDLFNLYYKAYYGSKNISTRNKQKDPLYAGGIVTSLFMIKKIQKKFLHKNGDMFFLADSYHVGDDDFISARKQLDPEYKRDRNIEKPHFYRGIDLLIMILYNYFDNFFVLKVPGAEADDLIEPLKDIVDTGKKFFLLISSDLDWAQYISDRIHWMKDKETILDKIKFKQIYKFSPEGNTLKFYKCFRGDRSDNIPKGVPYIPSEIMLRIINFPFKDMKDLLSRFEFELDIPKIWALHIKENSARLILNYELVSPLQTESISDYLLQSNFHPRMLKSMYEKIGLIPYLVDDRFKEEKVVPGAFLKPKKAIRR